MRKLFFTILLGLTITSKAEVQSLIKKSENAVQETRRITHNLLKNHPYVTTLLGYFLLRYMTSEKTGLITTINNKPVYWPNVHNSLPTTALLTSIGLDVFYNKCYSVPGQILTAFKELLDTYGTSKNTEFISRSFDWLINTIKKVPEMIN
jgi:hypothetical protein